MGRKKSKKSIDDAVRNLIQNEVNNLPDMDSDGSDFVLPSENDPHVHHLVDNEKDNAIINKLLASFPSTEGYYGKLYVKAANGKLIFKHFLDMLEALDDPEIEILNLIKERGWDDGEYFLRVFKRGQPECKQTINWHMAVQPKHNTGGNQIVKNDNVHEKLAEITGILQAVKGITGDNNSMNPGDTAKFLSEAFKSGIETVKNSMPPPNQENSLDKTIATLKNLNLLKTEEKTDSIGELIKLLAIVKELGIFGEKKQDTWSEIIKLKELGLLKLANEEKDPLDQIEKLRNLIEMATTLTGGSLGGGEKPSLGLELVRVLGPAVPRMVENITDTVKSFAEVSKLKMSGRIPNIPQIPPQSPKVLLDTTNMDPYGKSEISPNITEDKYQNPYEQSDIEKNKPVSQEETNVRNPIVQEIYTAAKNNDETFFPKLRDLINLYVGGNVIEKLMSREVTVPSFLQTLHTYLRDPFFLEDGTLTYFNKFLSWHIDEVRQNTIIGTCNLCKEQYEYLSKEEWDADIKKCECGGLIEQLTVSLNGGNA